jgi:hypothetical protein
MRIGDLPYRGDGFGRPRSVPLPPARLPMLRGRRLRTQWPYVAAWSEAVSICAVRLTPESEPASLVDLIVIRSAYRQPFGTFTGTLPGGLEVLEGYGVMEDHGALWWPVPGRALW